MCVRSHILSERIYMYRYKIFICFLNLYSIGAHTQHRHAEFVFVVADV